uniref:Uncharacterized protein n=1 Tax=Knipowitschia caucasica TaxID=637954 RepID=A0AAV2JRX6_KNICA
MKLISTTSVAEEGMWSRPSGSVVVLVVGVGGLGWTITVYPTSGAEVRGKQRGSAGGRGHVHLQITHTPRRWGVLE